MPILKGTWLFNEITEEDYNDFPGVVVNFTSNGEQFVAMESQLWPIDYIRKDGSAEGALIVGTRWQWASEELRIVDFGLAEQEVTEDFYNWFINNATEYNNYESNYAIRSDTLINLADAIRDKAKLAERLTPGKMIDAVKSIVANEFTQEDLNGAFEQGEQFAYDQFWDMYQNEGNAGNYRYAFAYRWDDNNYHPKYDILCNENSDNSNAIYLFYNASSLTDTKVNIYVYASLADYMFTRCRSLETIPLLHLEGPTRFSSCFAGCTALKNLTIGGSINASFSLKDSTLLTNESVQSVIDHLKEFDAPNSATLTLAANVGAKLTELQIATIGAKNWNLVF